MAPTRQSFEDVSQVINSVLITSNKSQTVGIPLVELDRLYSEFEGTTIPYRAVGFACLIDLLEEMQNQNKIGLYKKNGMTMVYLGRVQQAAHVTKLVSAQKDSYRRPVRGGKRFTPRSYPSAKTFNPPVLNSKHLVEVVKFVAENPDGIHKSKMLEYVQDRIDFHFEEIHLTHHLQSINHEVIFKNDYYYPVSNNQSTWESPSTKKATTTTKTSSTDNRDDDYRWDNIQSNTTNTQFPLTNTNAINKLHENIQSMDNKIDEKANSTKENGNCGGTDGDAGLLVKQRIKFRLEKLIQNRPDGIWCAELPSLYQREYSIPLNYENLGFDSVNDFASNLPNIFHCVRPHESGDFKLFYAKELLPDLKPTQKPTKETLASIYSNWENTYGEKDKAVPDALPLSVSHMLIPDGVMEPGESVPQISVTGLFPHEDSSIGVIAVEVQSPTFFWIQLHQNVLSFHSFMTELHEFYTTHASKYVVPIVILSKGLNCAARFDNKWHRGIIKIVHPDNRVTINFYDYGTEVKYLPEEVHYLHRSFSNIPAQAIPCGLFGIKPKASSHWTEKVTGIFAKAILDVSLYALLGTLDEMGDTVILNEKRVEQLPLSTIIEESENKQKEMIDEQAKKLVEFKEELDRQAMKIAELAEQAMKVPELEKQAMKVPELEKQAMKVPELENQVNQLFGIAKRAMKIPALEKQLIQLYEVVKQQAMTMVGFEKMQKIDRININTLLGQLHQLENQKTLENTLV